MLKNKINKIILKHEKERKTKLIDKIKWEISYEYEVKLKQHIWIN